MTPYYQDDQTTVHHGDCIEVMRNMPENSVDAIVTDPPYGLGFMGAKWDALPPGKDWAEECLRVLKPGGHLLAFGGTRTWHRLAVAIEDAGFEIRDSVMWLYGSGFPKSHDVGKAIDKAREDSSEWRTIGKALRSSREAAGYRTRRAFAPLILDGHKNLESAAANLSNWENGLSFPTWERWQSLKAILSLPDDMDAEVWRLNGRKGQPGENWGKREVLSTRRDSGGRSVSIVGKAEASDYNITTPATDAAKQWSGWGTALKPANEPIVMARKPFKGTVAANVLEHGTGALNIDATRIPGSVPSKPQPVYGVKVDGVTHFGSGEGRNGQMSQAVGGRWPANVILDEHTAQQLDEQTFHLKGGVTVGRNRNSSIPSGGYDGGWKKQTEDITYGDSGGASRFFYVAKAPKRERPEVNGVKHATVKPLTLMRYLVRMVTPPNGIVLDPFAGSGTTIEAALLEGFQSIGIELTDEYLPLIQQRIQRQGVGAAMSTKYHVCDHPELLVKDETCFLCDQIDGQVDAFDHIEEVGR